MACAGRLMAAQVDDDFFEARIRPVLSQRCFECHGSKQAKGGLRVDSREALLKGGQSGTAVIPADADGSQLVKAIRRSDPNLQMPPKSPLEKSVVDDFVRWINAGANWPRAANSPATAEADEAARTVHWAFVAPQKREPPAIINPAWTGEIDRFIAAKWHEQQLKPVSQADSRTLVRRLYFDLIGLPPSPAQMDQAVASLTPWSDAAWMTLVNQLLESPHYGERWGRHWLDVVRYADTAGDNADYPVPEARLYRDYVIDSYNADKPYDQFVREQIAGDILAADGPRERYAEQVAATGFLALSRRYATAPYELWHLTLEDTIDTVGQTFLGLTLRCARCHDHKFDPVTQRDYYALYGIFESTQFPWAGGEEFQSKKFPREHFVPLIPRSEYEPLLTAYRDQEKQAVATLERQEAENPRAISVASLAEQIAALKSASASPGEIADLQREHDRVKKKLDTVSAQSRAPMEAVRRRGFPETIPIAYAVSEGKPHSAAVQRSGDPAQAGVVVPRGVPAFLTAGKPIEIPDTQSGRRQLADWLTKPDHPLTPRVMVNRIWQGHFGHGLVASVSNFGTRGTPASHPELLDWLSQRFVEQGWSVKALHRLILSSSVWRLASDHDPANATRDPGNVYLWRHDRQRLEAEAIRDAMLTVSAQLDLSRPGLQPFPEINKWNYTQHVQFKDFYASRHRSVYLMTPRLQRHPFLSLFDGPDTNTTTGQRTSSIVAAQALYLMNSDEVKSEATWFAKRLIAAAPDVRISTAYRLAFQRQPTADEAAQATEFVKTYQQRTDEQSAWTALCRTLMTSNDFFYVD